MIRLKRAYEPPSPADGERILVERLWPRGVSKSRAAVDLWLKDVAPTAALRQWFGHDPARWAEFRRRYWKELQGNPQCTDLLRRKARRGTVTLVYAARDEQHNGALALKAFLERRTPRAAGKQPPAKSGQRAADAEQAGDGLPRRPVPYSENRSGRGSLRTYVPPHAGS